VHPTCGGLQTPGLARVPVLVNRQRQAGNRFLELLQAVPWQLADGLGPDFVMGSACALVLSLRFHLRNPQYVPRRLATARAGGFRVRALVLVVDLPEGAAAAADTVTLITTLALGAGFTLLCAATQREAARFLELLHVLQDPVSRRTFLGEAAVEAAAANAPAARTLATLLAGSLRALTAGDAAELARAHGGALNRLARASRAELEATQGVGPVKAAELWDALNAPFDFSS